ncbi:MAG: PQQ-dependent sugar dehydrogenase [Acidobacteria bacterium]|nr:PQQ-dependent sugar dehydrogenase [Acidobacteriota bacterium]MBV9071755.1 PQQ-dependent sugar dehydrogenase [Acidobacteriota bacterium]MBV9187043.1 PQQ-dependent sugar dehydrogenase [Acidobacteriota bacterium]
MKRLLLIFLLSASANAATLPGFHVQLVQATAGFITALAADSQGTLYYSVKSGDIIRAGVVPVVVAHVPTVGEGNSGLIGLALRDDHTAIVHYTTPRQTYDVVSAVDLVTGVETEIHRFATDRDFPERGVSTEHHGGNLTIAPDGSIFLAIGDYGVGIVASELDWNGGKVWRILPDGTVIQFAHGFRNPFDLAWDAAAQRVIVTDNGDAVDDEIDVVAEGDDCGWPATAGKEPAVAGARTPAYVFPTVIAPTGLAPLTGRNPILRRGYLLGSYVAKALFYVPDVYAQPVPDPVAVIQSETDPIIDVIEAPDGDIYFASGFGIYRLIVPAPGDCNGDGVVNSADIAALANVLAGGPRPMTAVQNASWGCDANRDGMIDARDLSLVAALVRGRAVRR